MNSIEAQQYEEKRRQTAQAGAGKTKTTGALAPFTAQLLTHDKVTATYKEDYDVGRAYAKEQFGTAPTPGKQFALLNKLEQKINAAKGQDPALRDLGEYIAFKTGSTWIQGPIKIVGGTKSTDRGAFNKTVKDYFSDWSANKDLIRGTCAARTEAELLSIVAQLQIICSPIYGMSLMKRLEVKKDDSKNPCGYSGWNFVVVMKGSAIPAEIQANTWAMMYGKMSKADYSSAFLGGSEAEYFRTEHEMGFEGALGHLFYEIWQQDKAGQDGKAAATLSRRYCDMCRMAPSERIDEAKIVSGLIDAFEGVIKSSAAKNIWAKRATH